MVHQGQPTEVLLLPHLMVDLGMYLLHSHPLGSHLAVQSTLEKIQAQIFWPGMDAEVQNFCHCCLQCQHTSPKKNTPAPLIPLPIIEVPFERVGIDLVSPLLESARGHEYILVIMDYATCYPKAVPL